MSKKNNSVLKEDFIEYYIIQNHTVIETQHHFHIGGTKFDNYRKQWNVYKNDEQKKDIELKKQRKRYRKIQERYEFSKEDFFNYYCVENHSVLETQKFFNISGSKFYSLLRKWNIKKSTEQTKQAQQTASKRTCQEKFGCDWPTQNINVIQKQFQTKLDRYGDNHYNNPSKNKETNLKNHNNKLFHNVDKILETKRAHKTFNTSKIEEVFYEQLCNILEKSDIIRQYQDARYTNPKTNIPWCCDFYIKSKDMFIEINFYAAHGTHPFNSNDQKDIEKLNKLNRRKGYYISHTTGKLRKNCYWGFIETWTVVDPSKISIAAKNNLNYVMLYNEQEIAAFLKTLSSGE